MEESCSHSTEKQPKWAWLALIALCYVALLFGGCVKSIGILYVEFLEIFEQGPVVTSLLQTIFLVCLTIGTVTGGAVSDRLPLLLLLVVAGMTIAAGYAITAFAPNFIVVLFGFGAIAGFGVGLITSTPPSTLVTLFHKKRHLAVGLYFCCSSIGSTVMPLLYGVLISSIQVKGMLLVNGGMWLLLIVVGIVLQPKKIEETQTTIRKMNTGKFSTNGTTERVKGDLENRANLEEGNTNANNNTYLESVSEDAMKNGKINEGYVKDETDKLGDHNPKKIESVNIEQPSINSSENQTSPKPAEEGKLRQMLVVVRTCKFWLFVFIISLSQMGNFSAIYQLPSFAKEKGQSLTGQTLVIATFGICDLSGRVIFGYLGDKRFANRFTILTCCQIVAGGGVLALTFVDIAAIPYLISVILGLCGGIHVVYAAPLVADIVPTKVTGSANGIAFMAMFLCTAAIQTPAGLLQARTGTYATGLQMASGFYLLAAMVTAPLGLSFIFHKFTSKGYDIN